MRARSFPATSASSWTATAAGRRRGASRAREGHLEGVKAAKRVVAAAAEAGLAFLSLYTFSTENWARAEEEVSYLMFLVRSYLRKEYDFYRAERDHGSCTAGTWRRLPRGHRQGDRGGRRATPRGSPGSR